MVERILHTLGGIERYGIASMSLFILVFVGVLFWTFLQKKSHLDYMARVALDPEPESHSEAGVEFLAPRPHGPAGSDTATPSAAPTPSPDTHPTTLSTPLP